MGDPCLNSPRRVLSLSKERERATVDKSSGFAVSKENGPNPSEVYGFVGSISTVVATVLFLIWAYIPEPWLHSVGITYYPSRYWAFAVPIFAMVAVVLAIGFYVGLNFMVTPPPTSFNTMFDEYSREPTKFADTTRGEEQPIEPLSDIGFYETRVAYYSWRGAKLQKATDLHLSLDTEVESLFTMMCRNAMQLF